MKRSPRITPLQKAFILVMAAWVLVLAIFISRNSDPDHSEPTYEHNVAFKASSYVTPNIVQTPELLPSFKNLFLALPRMWHMLISGIAPEIQEYKAVFLQVFIQPVQFVFVSTKAP